MDFDIFTLGEELAWTVKRASDTVPKVDVLVAIFFLRAILPICDVNTVAEDNDAFLVLKKRSKNPTLT